MTPNIFNRITSISPPRTKSCISLRAPIRETQVTLSEVYRLSSELRVLRMDLFLMSQFWRLEFRNG